MYSGFRGRAAKMPARFQSIVGGSVTFSDGNDMPKIGLGMSRITQQSKLTAAISAALKSGYRMFDTANIYGNEAQMGKALQKLLPENGLRREDIFITTKVPIRNKNAATNVEEVIQESLEKLQTELAFDICVKYHVFFRYLDLVLIHYPRDRFTGNDDDEENERAREETWKKLEQIHGESETIRSIGVSNYEVYHLVEMEKYAKVRPVLNQCEYHPYLTKKLLKRYCEKKNIVFQAFSSLCWGNKEILNETPVKAFAAKYAVSPQTILYAFALCTNVCIIPKSENSTRIAANLHDTLKATLTAGEVRQLKSLNQNRYFCPMCEPEECI